GGGADGRSQGNPSAAGKTALNDSCPAIIRPSPVTGGGDDHHPDAECKRLCWRDLRRRWFRHRVAQTAKTGDTFLATEGIRDRAHRLNRRTDPSSFFLDK